MLPYSAVAVVVLAAAVPALAQDLTELYRNVSPSVVHIETRGSLNQELGVGSGFFLEPGVVVTNQHVIEGASAAMVHLKNGSKLEVAGVIAMDRERDLALLSVPDQSLPGPLPLSTTAAEPGQEVFLIGSPEGLSSTISKGIVSGVRTWDAAPKMGALIQTTAAASHGSSGGPLLNMNGEVVGVLTLGHTTGNEIYFAVPAARIRDLKRGDVRPLRDIVPPLTLAEAPPDVPEAILEQIHPSRRRLIEQNAKYYVLLPDGYCLNLYRLIRIRELQPRRGSTDADRELEALRIHRVSEGEVRVEGDEPPAAVGPSDLRPYSAVAGYERYRAAPNTHVVGLHEGDTDFFIWPLGQQVEGKPAYMALHVEDWKPTPAQLAFAIKQGKAELVVFDYTRSEVQPYRWRRGPTTLKARQKVKDGPVEVTYRWETREYPVEFIDTAAEPARPAAEQPEQAKPAGPAVKPTHRIKMKDGRELDVVMVDDVGRTLVVDVIVGGIVARTTLPRHEVEEVVAVE